MAWLSTSAKSPSTRFTTKSPAGYIRPDKTLVAATWADLIDPGKDLLAPINRTEALAVVDALARAATATLRSGALSGTTTSLTCDDWSESVSGPAGQGNPSATNGDWTDMGGTTGLCVIPNAYVLYCFQQ